MRPEQKLFTFRSWKYHDNVKEGLSNAKWRDAFKDGLKEVCAFHGLCIPDDAYLQAHEYEERAAIATPISASESDDQPGMVFTRASYMMLTDGQRLCHSCGSATQAAPMRR